MKVVFISNFINHHQVELCNYLYNSCEEFKFVEMKTIPTDLLKFGYDDLQSMPYVIKYDESLDEAIADADVAICGADADKFIHLRMKENKLTFIYSERIWKKGTYRRFIPFIRKKVKEKFYSYRNKNLFVLCASCFLPYDLSLIGFPVEKCFKWGYFTKFEELDVQKTFNDKSNEPLLIWCARFIPLKHFEDVLKAIKLLKKDGYKFKLNVIGSGVLENKYHLLIDKYGIENQVEFKGNLSQSLVRDEMKKGHIFIFSSDFHEGWGAVVNEAMNSLCVPIVSHAVGASAFLINNGKNGYVYKCRNVKDLYCKIKLCLDDFDIINEKAALAYNTIATSYNAIVAGERFLKFCECFFEKKPFSAEDGPMSQVGILKNKWINKI